MSPLVALLVAVSVGAYAGPAGDPPPEAAERSHKIAIVWEAGASPVKPGEYMDALTQRLPPERFEPVPVGATKDAWVVRVQQPQPGVYRLEVAPPGREPEARRLMFGDPVVARRRLAILTAFVLEQGRFPELVEGSGIVADEVEPEPEAGTIDAAPATEPRTVPATEPGTSATERSGSPAPLPARRLRIVWSAAGVVVVPTTPRNVAVPGTPGYGADIDLGLRALGLLWTGALAGYSVHPGGSVIAHRAQGGVFAGVRPQLDRWHFGARLTAVGGSVIGALGRRTLSRPYVAGGLGIRGAWSVPGNRGVALFVGARTELASRSSTFTSDSDGDGGRGAALGRVRFGVQLGVSWMSGARDSD